MNQKLLYQINIKIYNAINPFYILGRLSTGYILQNNIMSGERCFSYNDFYCNQHKIFNLDESQHRTAASRIRCGRLRIIRKVMCNYLSATSGRGVLFYLVDDVRETGLSKQRETEAQVVAAVQNYQPLVSHILRRAAFAFLIVHYHSLDHLCRDIDKM